MHLVTPFGNYLVGNSWLHRLDARLKLLLMVVYAIAIFVLNSWLGLLLCLGLLSALSLRSQIPLSRLARGLAPVLVILAFTFVAHAFSFTAQTELAPLHPLLPWYSDFTLDDLVLIQPWAFSPAGALDGLFFALRIVALVGASTLLTLSSPLLRIADAIAALLRPLAIFRVPVEDIAMVFSIALRFIPLTAEESEKIRYALAARGLRFGEGGPLRRLRAWQPVLVPLFVGLFRRADALATAMEARCYDGSRRTRQDIQRLIARALIPTLALSAALLALGVLL